MTKLFLLFGLLWWLLGDPFLALLVLLVILYMLERRFIGLSPSIVKPFRRRAAIRKWRRQLELNSHDVSAKSELARLLIESRKYTEAEECLLGMEDKMDHSAEYWSDLGSCQLALGQLEDGERSMLRALTILPRVKYGQPDEAAKAFAECPKLYRTLPRYMRRHERKWLLRSLLRRGR